MRIPSGKFSFWTVSRVGMEDTIETLEGDIDAFYRMVRSPLKAPPVRLVDRDGVRLLEMAVLEVETNNFTPETIHQTIFSLLRTYYTPIGVWGGWTGRMPCLTFRHTVYAHLVRRKRQTALRATLAEHGVELLVQERTLH